MGEEKGVNGTIQTAVGTAIVAMSLISGCSDRYSMHANGRDPKLYRPDRYSGKVDMIDGKTMTPVTDTEQEDASLDSLRDWGEKELPRGGAKIQLATKWRNGQLLYLVRVTARDSLAAAAAVGDGLRVTLYLVDKDGFKIDQIVMETSETDMVTNQGGATGEAVRSGWHPMDSQTYRKLAGWRFSL